MFSPVTYVLLFTDDNLEFTSVIEDFNLGNVDFAGYNKDKKVLLCF